MDAVTSPPRGKSWNQARDWIAAHPYWALTLAVFVLLGPFLGKPFNMDDPLFIWTARQIQAHPFNPYGFNVNWYRTAEPIWSVMQNPPLASYYLALAAGILGWSEPALHGALLLPALAVILGTYRLALRFCDQSMLAALITLFTPVFLVSSNTVMCDVLMLAFWVWAVALWVEGMERDAFWLLAVAGLLMALASLTKYFGACLIPLLAAYSLISKRQIGRWAVCLLIPLLVLCAWQWATRTLYHNDLLLNAVDYAGHKSGFFAGTRVLASMTALTFTGGCLAVAVFMMPWLWRRRTLFALAGGTAALVMALFCEGTLQRTFPWINGSALFPVEAQIVLWAIAGTSVLALAVADVWNHRDAHSWLLGLWVSGTFIFTGVFNWTINGRSILPMAPVVGILITRRYQQLARTNANGPGSGHRRIVLPLAASAIFALLVARSDFLQAVAVRESARQTHERYANAGRTLWFEGHWGFQYYMTELGDPIMDLEHSVHHPGDYLALPLNNSNVHYPDFPQDKSSYGGPRFLAVMNEHVGAGFYSSLHGPLPFVFGRVPPEYVMTYH